MWFYVGLLLLVLVLLYSTRWFWNAPKRIEPSGKIVVVTGTILNHFIKLAIIISFCTGAASGFGYHTTKQLVEKGCCVIAVDVNQEALEKQLGFLKDVHTFKCKSILLAYI